MLWNRHKLSFYVSNFSTVTEKQVLASDNDRPWFKLTDERDTFHQLCHYAHYNCQKSSFLHIVVGSLLLSSLKELHSIYDSHMRTNYMPFSSIVLVWRLAEDILKITQQGFLGPSSMTQFSVNQWNSWRSVATAARAALRYVERDILSSDDFVLMLVFLNSRQFPHADSFLSGLI